MPDFKGERERSIGPAIQVLTAGTARAVLRHLRLRDYFLDDQLLSTTYTSYSLDYQAASCCNTDGGPCRLDGLPVAGFSSETQVDPGREFHVRITIEACDIRHSWAVVSIIGPYRICSGYWSDQCATWLHQSLRRT